MNLLIVAYIRTMNDISHFSAGISVLEITYILASVLFILGLKKLSHPLTARRGNMLAAVGMVPVSYTHLTLPTIYSV